MGNQGQKVDFGGRCHISTSGFAAAATETAVFALFLPVQLSDWHRTRWYKWTFWQHTMCVLSDFTVRIETGSSFSHNS